MPSAEKPTESTSAAVLTPQPSGLVLQEQRVGTGTPLVLLHAFPVDSRMWTQVIDLLPPGIPVYTVDLPGLGTAPSPEQLGQHLDAASGPTLELAADGVAAAFADTGLKQAVFIGLSMGGYAALALLERHPDFVAGLGLFDTKTTADLEQGRTNRLRIAHDLQAAGNVDSVLNMAETLVGETTAATRPDVVQQIRTWISEQSADAVAWSQRAMAARPDRTDVLIGFDGPVSVVVGEQDTLSPVAASRLMAQNAPNSTFDIIADVGHLTAVEAPEQVAQVVVKLMARVQ